MMFDTLYNYLLPVFSIVMHISFWLSIGLHVVHYAIGLSYFIFSVMGWISSYWTGKASGFWSWMFHNISIFYFLLHAATAWQTLCD